MPELGGTGFSFEKLLLATLSIIFVGPDSNFDDADDNDDEEDVDGFLSRLLVPTFETEIKYSRNFEQKNVFLTLIYF